jgi:hypothetical protein
MPIFPCPEFVTPAKAGVQLRRCKFGRPGLDSRLRGNDEVVFELNYSGF